MRTGFISTTFVLMKVLFHYGYASQDNSSQFETMKLNLDKAIEKIVDELETPTVVSQESQFGNPEPKMSVSPLNNIEQPATTAVTSSDAPFDVQILEQAPLNSAPSTTQSTGPYTASLPEAKELANEQINFERKQDILISEMHDLRDEIETLNKNWSTMDSQKKSENLEKVKAELNLLELRREKLAPFDKFTKLYQKVDAFTFDLTTNQDLKGFEVVLKWNNQELKAKEDHLKIIEGFRSNLESIANA